MPNHFHLLIKQTAKGGMKTFIHSLLLRYSRYFNQKYKRVGPLFQGRYKAVLIDSDPYLLHLSRYIHLNPSEHLSNLTEAYSSYADYLGIRNTSWVNTKTILAYFNQVKTLDFKSVNKYMDFVEKYNSKNIINILDGLTLE
jgi:putative transposase